MKISFITKCKTILIRQLKEHLWKIKIIVFLIFLFNIKYFQLATIKHRRIEELEMYLNNFDILKKKPTNITDNLYLEEKTNIINMFLKNQNLTSYDTMFINTFCNFGNCIAILNKLIFYCEIIGCKNIILNKDIYWFINNNITINNNNFTISTDDNKKYNNSYSFFYNSLDIFFSLFKLKQEVRINYLINEILLNLPKMKTHEKDLYIHLRSGDAFAKKPSWLYAQPPLCFYNNILKNFKFRKIYIISSGTQNPILFKLLNEFLNILFFENSIKEDISLLINAYNIVNSVSSFVNSIIQLNYNLLYLWEYNIYHIDEKVKHYFHDFNIYPYNNYTVFRMEPSSFYLNKMYKWKNTRSQIHLMLKEKCVNQFIIFRDRNYIN